MLSYIDTRQGTDSVQHFSTGNTLPITNVPFGMHSYVPETLSSNGGWFFNPNHQVLEGVRISHQPSPWISDFGHFCVMPFTGKAYHHPRERASSYRPEDAIFAPHYSKLHLLRYEATMELAPGERGARLQLTYAGDEQPGFVISVYDNLSGFTIDYENNRVTGYTNAVTACEDLGMKTYFVLTFDTPFRKDSGFLSADDFLTQDTFEGAGRRCVLYFDAPESVTVQAGLAVSFVSAEQALLNLSREPQTFVGALRAAEALWESYLGRIEITSKDESLLRTFYTCLYRTFCFPQKMYELDADGAPVHYCTRTKRVEPGIMYTNNGFWDTYKTVYPLFSLIAPAEYAEMLEGFLIFAREFGYLPKWLSPDERGAMPGTMIDAVIADACAKGIGMDLMEEALAAMIHAATVPHPSGHFGRRNVDKYIQHGYVPCDDCHETVNYTLDYAYSDYCISVVAAALGKDDIAQEYRERAANYRNVFDAESGLMRGKFANGTFRAPFVPHEWGEDYCEGSAWQNSFAVYHDFQGLQNLYGGETPFLTKLTELFNAKPRFRVDVHNCEIHEMSEMAAVDFGQCAVSNQPSFHLPFLFTYAGRPDLTQFVTKQLLTNLFNDGFRGYPGDEDNGSMAAFFVFNALGLYPVCPGAAEYVLTIPLVDSAVLHLPDGKFFTIHTRENAPHKMFVASRTLNGAAYDKQFLRHTDIVHGGAQTVTIGLVPPVRTYAADTLPFSMTRAEG